MCICECDSMSKCVFVCVTYQQDPAYRRDPVFVCVFDDLHTFPFHSPQTQTPICG